jgi:hypothetical protein
MSTWEIRVPHRGRDELLIDTASNCRHLPEGERDVARHVVFDAMQDGVRTAGELLDRLDGLEPAERRQLLDHARVEAGLPTIAEVDAGMRAELASKAGAVVAAQYNPQLCHGKTPAGHACNAVGMTDYGVPAPTNVRRWHCAEHRDQARPGDMDPLPAPWRYSDSGAIVEVDPVELAREQAAAESRRRREQARLEDAAVEAEAIREHQAAIDAQADRELPPHLRAVA